MEMVKENLLKKILYFVLFFVTTSFIFAGLSYGDTYNFHFSKEKKKKSRAQQEASYGDESPSEDEGEEEEASEPKPAPKTVEKAPVVIHNINTITNPPVAPPAPAPVVAPPTPAPVAQAPIQAQAVLEQKISQSSPISSLQLGLGGDYHPRGQPAPIVSLGYRPNALGLNIYATGFLSYARLGAELEVYPLAYKYKDALVEVGILGGAEYASDRDFNNGSKWKNQEWGIGHLGARVIFNFHKDFALSGVGRVSECNGSIPARVEASILIRL